MKELICLNIGQAGVQISNAIWELMCIEHEVNPDGHLMTSELSDTCHSRDNIFLEVSENQFVPRCLTIDLEPTVIDEIRTGVYRNLFAPTQLISGMEDSSSNFARGHFTVGKYYLEEVLNVLRQMIQLCDSPQGFMIIQSFGGGCGSGFTSLLMEQINIEHGKRSKMLFSILPSTHMSSAIVEPYNSVLSGKSCIETTDLCFQHDNQSIYRVVQDKLEVTNPSFTNINRLLAQVFSSLTVSVRYENSLNNDLNQIAINLIPYPRLHYLIDIYSPMCNMRNGIHFQPSTAEITKDIFNLENRFLDCSFIGEKFISCCLQYRGNVNPSEVNKTLVAIKKMETIDFVDWCPTGFKIGITRYPSVSSQHCYLYDTERSLLLLCNNTCFHQKIGNLNSKFDILFSKRSFVHWFVGEGMEESEFLEARQEFAFIEEDYKCLNQNYEIMDKASANKGTEVQETYFEQCDDTCQEEKILEKADFNEPYIITSDVDYKDFSPFTETSPVELVKVSSVDSKLTDNIVKHYHTSSFHTNTNLGDESLLKLPTSTNIPYEKTQDSDNTTERNERLRQFLKEEESTQSDISTI